MPNLSAWIFGGLTTLIGLCGLVLAAHAADSVMYGVGLALFVFAMLFDFWLIKSGFDRGA